MTTQEIVTTLESMTGCEEMYRTILELDFHTRNNVMLALHDIPSTAPQVSLLKSLLESLFVEEYNYLMFLVSNEVEQLCNDVIKL